MASRFFSPLAAQKIFSRIAFVFLPEPMCNNSHIRNLSCQTTHKLASRLIRGHIEHGWTSAFPTRSKPLTQPVQRTQVKTRKFLTRLVILVHSQTDRARSRHMAALSHKLHLFQPHCRKLRDRFCCLFFFWRMSGQNNDRASSTHECVLHQFYLPFLWPSVRHTRAVCFLCTSHEPTFAYGVSL